MIRFAAILILGGAAALAPAQTEITYQGSLTNNAQPYTGSADLAFSLWDAASGGSQVSTTVRIDDVAVAGGLLTCEVDFGVDPFGDATRWLEVSVRTPHDPTDLVPYDTLDPRQKLSRSPYALQTRGIYVDDDQNVGIGTTSPQHELHVEGLRPTVNIAATENNVTAYPSLRFTGAPGPSLFQSLGSIEFHDDTGAFRALISANKSGPDAAHFNFVPADGAQSQLQIYEGLLRTYDMFEVRSSIDLELGAQIGVDGGDSLFQLQGGNVGIGTISPGTNLEIADSSAAGPVLTMSNPASSGSSVAGTIRFDSGLGTQATIGYVDPTLGAAGLHLTTPSGSGVSMLDDGTVEFGPYGTSPPHAYGRIGADGSVTEGSEYVDNILLRTPGSKYRLIFHDGFKLNDNDIVIVTPYGSQSSYTFMVPSVEIVSGRLDVTIWGVTVRPSSDPLTYARVIDAEFSFVVYRNP